MNVTIVGSGCGIPNPKRGSPCVSVSVENELFIFDCGPGALRAMGTADVDWAGMDKIFITHFHTDHIGDIAPLLFAFNIPDVNRTGLLSLHGPPGLKELYDGLVAAYGDWIVPKRYDLIIEELRVGPLAGRTWSGEVAPSEHSEPSYAYRFEAGAASLVYSGDTDYSEDIIKLATDCDLLILECSYPNDLEVSGHLTPKKAGEMARLAGCRKLALTHMYPVCEDYDLVSECRQTYDGDVVAAEDGMQFKLSGR